MAIPHSGFAGRRSRTGGFCEAKDPGPNKGFDKRSAEHERSSGNPDGESAKREGQSRTRDSGAAEPTRGLRSKTRTPTGRYSPKTTVMDWGWPTADSGKYAIMRTSDLIYAGIRATLLEATEKLQKERELRR